MNTSKMIGLKTLSVAIVLIGLSSCTTTSGNKDNQLTETKLKENAKEPIVIETEAKETVVSKVGRENWVSLRKNTKNDHVRLYADLGIGDWQVAIADARNYLAKHPKDEVGLKVLATALAMDGSYSLAAYYASLVEKYHGDYSEAENIRGLALLYAGSIKMRDYKKAMQHFENAFAKSPNQIASGFNLGYLQLKIGNAAAAQRTFKQVDDRCDSCNESLLGRGIAYIRLRDYANAKNMYEKVLDKQPNHALALYRLALVEKNGYNNNKKSKAYLERILANVEGNDPIKRQANTVLRKMQAAEVGQKLAERERAEEDDRDRSKNQRSEDADESDIELQPVSNEQ